MNKTTIIKPYKWSCWDFQVFKRGDEYAFIVTEHKWATLSIDGDYKLIPVDQHKLLAPLYKGIEDNSQYKSGLYFSIDKPVAIEEAEGGYITVEFINRDLMLEYNNLEQQDNNSDLCEMELLFEMGFEETDIEPTVIKFTQRKDADE